MKSFKPPAAAPQIGEVAQEPIGVIPTVNPMILPAPKDIVGFQFIKKHNGFPHKAKVIETMDEGDKFLVSLGDGEREEIITYNEILGLVEAQLDQDEGKQTWTFESILDHRKTKKGGNEILILWTTGEESWESLSWIADQDPITIAEYAKANLLLGKSGWKRFRKYVNQGNKFIRMVKQANATKTNSMKVKFGVEVPRHYKDALRLDEANGNKLWQEAIKTELDQIFEYRTFKDHGKNKPAPKEHKRINVHFVFDIKFDLRRKARLVAGGHLTAPIYNDAPYAGKAIYSGWTRIWRTSRAHFDCTQGLIWLKDQWCQMGRKVG